MHSVRLLNSKERAKQKASFDYLHWMNYEHVDRNAKIRYLIASSHYTHKTIVIIINNHNKVCPFFFFINVGQIIYFLFPFVWQIVTQSPENFMSSLSVHELL